MSTKRVIQFLTHSDDGEDFRVVGEIFNESGPYELRESLDTEFAKLERAFEQAASALFPNGWEFKFSSPYKHNPLGVEAQGNDSGGVMWARIQSKGPNMSRGQEIPKTQ